MTQREMGCASSRDVREPLDTHKHHVASAQEDGPGEGTKMNVVYDLLPRVVALYDYVARTQRELTFRAGDLIICTLQKTMHTHIDNSVAV